LQRIVGIGWLEVVCNVELWKATEEKPVALQSKKRKWWWIGHKLRKNDGSMEKQALDWNLQGVEKRNTEANLEKDCCRQGSKML
jgi:hypothetical protein